jgi:tetratricopeptide (TPR) repeat protein
MNRAQRRRIEKEQRKKNSALPPLAFEELIGEAMRRLQNGNIVQADELLTGIVKAYPNEPTSLHFAGVTKYQLGSYSEASKLINRSLKLAPTYAEAHNSLGIVHLEQRDYGSAYDCFSKAIRLRPDYPNAHFNLGNALRRLDRLSEAVNAYENSLRYHPHSSESAYSLAAVFLAQNKPDAALKTANQCLAIDRYCQNAIAYKAIALSQLNQKDQWHELYDFEDMIQKMQLAPPTGYKSLGVFNEDLEHEIRVHPTLTWEPLDRVTHGGAVTKDLLAQPSKVITLFEQALRGVIDSRIHNINRVPDHPFLGRTPGRYRLTLIASILQTKGWHPPHIHESAWLSGVYYVRVPSAVTESLKEHAGWLQFRNPDYKLPEHYTPDLTVRKPEEGMAVSFPSYLFHETIPYQFDAERIGIAFDVYPVS